MCPRNRLPVVTGRAVVEIFSVVVAWLLPLIGTDAVVNVAVDAVAGSVAVMDIVAVYVGIGVNVTLKLVFCPAVTVCWAGVAPTEKSVMACDD
jgi:hypothetical protein